MSRMEMRCGNTKCERCGKESVITIWHKPYDANLCGDCYKDANKNKKLFLTGVEVVPVIHAYWIGGDYGDWFCSECDSVLRFYGEPKHLRYCYRCGAKMDDEVK